MKYSGEDIILSQHAIQQTACRGASADEIFDTIKSAPWQPAELGRQECRKQFPFQCSWNNKKYDIKDVRPIFIKEFKEIIVATVYVYYFNQGE